MNFLMMKTTLKRKRIVYTAMTIEELAALFDKLSLENSGLPVVVAEAQGL